MPWARAASRRALSSSRRCRTPDPIYARPPLVEVVAEFRFRAATPWDPTIPGLVYEAVKVTYPGREPVAVIETEVSATAIGARQRTTKVDRVRFLSPEGNRMVQVGEGLLAVNRLPPYISWEDFLPTVVSAFAAYRSVATPNAFDRIGLRYINRVTLPAEAAVADYFAFNPALPEQDGGKLNGFVVGAQWAFDDDRDVLRVQLGEEASDAVEVRQYLFDLDYLLAQPDRVSLDEFEAFLDVAHTRVQAGFEAGITDAARAMFDVNQAAE